MMRGDELITIGDLAKRTGLSVTAIRFYETRGLVTALRSSGNQRRFMRSDIRRLSFALIAQKMGFSISDIASELEKLPQGRSPTRRDWQRISSSFGQILDQRIATLQATRDRLDGCIGCGCLSLQNCALYNPDDRIAVKGAGPRFIMGDQL